MRSVDLTHGEDAFREALAAQAFRLDREGAIAEQIARGRAQEPGPFDLTPPPRTFSFQQPGSGQQPGSTDNFWATGVPGRSRDSDERQERMEAMLTRLLEREEKTKQPALQRPAFEAIAASLDLFGASVQPLRRAVRLADRAPTEQVACALLPPLTQQALLQPELGDEALLKLALAGTPSIGADSIASQYAAVTPQVPAVVQPAVGLTMKAMPSGLGVGRLGRPVPSRSAEECFRCGHAGHRAGGCNATKDRDGQEIPHSQAAKFAPPSWKAQYGFDASGARP